MAFGGVFVPSIPIDSKELALQEHVEEALQQLFSEANKKTSKKDVPKEISKWLVNLAYNPFMNAVYWGYNMLTHLLPTSWDTQAFQCRWGWKTSGFFDRAHNKQTKVTPNFRNETKRRPFMAGAIKMSERMMCLPHARWEGVEFFVGAKGTPSKH